MDKEVILKYGVKLIIIFMILPIHEFAHAWTAHKLGDNTAYHKGRLTINPLAHIDIFGAVCLFFTGFGWAKPVPVNPLRFKKQRKGMALTAAAGPISNLIVALVGMVIFRLLATTDFYSRAIVEYYYSGGTSFYMFIMLEYFILVNIGLAIFNLIPIPPLDGSKILQYFTSYKLDAKIAQYQMYIYFGFLALMLSGVLTKPIGFLRDSVYNGMLFITDWIPALLG